VSVFREDFHLVGGGGGRAAKYRLPAVCHVLLSTSTTQGFFALVFLQGNAEILPSFKLVWHISQAVPSI